MSELVGRQKVLMMVKTYPHPLEKYNELVCTAGVTEDGRWIRLYPIDYRYRLPSQKFQKYQWIEVEIEKTPMGKDKRPESYRPKLETIRIVGEPIGTENKWEQRRKIIDQMPHRTLNEWETQWEKDRTSLGIVRPSEIIDLEVTKARDPDWKPKWKQDMAQLQLFGPERKKLRKIPYEFRYKFRCGDSDKIRTAMCEDWELGTLFLRQTAARGSDEAAAEDVKRRFLDDMCNATKDTRFFMGTRHPYNTWLVLGIFYPPKIKERQPDLFDV